MTNMLKQSYEKAVRDTYVNRDYYTDEKLDNVMEFVCKFSRKFLKYTLEWFKKNDSDMYDFIINGLFEGKDMHWFLRSVNNCLLFIGPMSQKISSAIAREAILNAYTPKRVSVSDLGDMLLNDSKSMDNYGSDLYNIKNSDLLIVDGFEHVTSFGYAKIPRVTGEPLPSAKAIAVMNFIDSRVSSGTPTIINSFIKADELVSYFGNRMALDREIQTGELRVVELPE